MMKDLLKYVIDNPIDFSMQESVVRDGHAWCADWWTIEILRCLILGDEEFDRLPSLYLEHNLLEKKCEIIREAGLKRKMMKILEEHKDFSNRILFCEVGRGIDIALANQIKKWEHIICYDNNQFIVEKVIEFFPEVYCSYVSTDYFDFSGITEPTILIAHKTRIRNREKEVVDNKNLLNIVDGALCTKELLNG